ncbi:hypothetical protein [Hyphomicrobium sp. MC1]|uniref:hypothetical protein n=1 Tax=Hyphomicrobium sp. (strain MC1) TaxID=717785 RepID=UPI000213EAD9|nr:hypothetical protein [Hyphomicrobium sp. MC1]CCB64080.1 protein of unknown function [Hyphomicrobium sp. MC1]
MNDNSELHRAIEKFKRGGGQYEDALKVLSGAYIAKTRDAEVVANVQHKLAAKALKKGN